MYNEVGRCRCRCVSPQLKVSELRQLMSINDLRVVHFPPQSFMCIPHHRTENYSNVGTVVLHSNHLPKNKTLLCVCCFLMKHRRISHERINIHSVHRTLCVCACVHHYILTHSLKSEHLRWNTLCWIDSCRLVISKNSKRLKTQTTENAPYDCIISLIFGYMTSTSTTINAWQFKDFSSAYINEW